MHGAASRRAWDIVDDSLNLVSAAAMIAPAVAVPRRSWRRTEWSDGGRMLAEETAVAITYNR